MEVSSGSFRGSAMKVAVEGLWKLPRNCIYFHWLPRNSINNYRVAPQLSGCFWKLPLLPWNLPCKPSPPKYMGESMETSSATFVALPRKCFTYTFHGSFHYFRGSFHNFHESDASFIGSGKLQLPMGLEASAGAPCGSFQ